MSNSPSVFIFCGEQSADIHGANLAKCLKNLRCDLNISGIGGKHLSEAGVKIFRDNADLAVVGFWEVVKHYGKFKKLLKDVVNYIERESIDIVILIDYPGFNLRLAESLKNNRAKIVYYISPQLWAWGKERLKIIKKYIDHIIVIFEFEKEIYEKAGISVSFVGHPLLDILNPDIKADEAKKFIRKSKPSPLIAYLPGSRGSEVMRLLPVFLESSKIIRRKIPDARFVISAASVERLNDIEKITAKFSKKTRFEKVSVWPGDVNQIISEASIVVVASGTASLQTALFLKPMVVVYTVNPLSYWIILGLIKTKYISIVNVVANEAVVPELIQNDCTSKNIVENVIRYINKDDYRDETIERLKKVRLKLGEPGASKRAAEIITGLL